MSTVTTTTALIQTVETAITEDGNRPNESEFGHRDDYPVPESNRKRIIARDGRPTDDGWVYSARFISDDCWRHQRIRWAQS
ncbi:hypothetical protein [Gordonia aichiensis]|uniref:hypothetical protein n=1 Tax=Gordonia aichiensis TaxID=36820 RepID=UPI0032679483